MYVYRFGSDLARASLVGGARHAWAILDGDRWFAEVSTSLTDIVEVATGLILGQLVEGSRTPSDASALEDFRRAVGRVHGAGRAPRDAPLPALDGSPREIEYHVTREGAGPDRHLAVIREIETA